MNWPIDIGIIFVLSVKHPTLQGQLHVLAAPRAETEPSAVLFDKTLPDQLVQRLDPQRFITERRCFRSYLRPSVTANSPATTKVGDYDFTCLRR
jgi:hypothetical protein